MKLWTLLGLGILLAPPAVGGINTSGGAVEYPCSVVHTRTHTHPSRTDAAEAGARDARLHDRMPRSSSQLMEHWEKRECNAEHVVHGLSRLAGDEHHHGDDYGDKPHAPNINTTSMAARFEGQLPQLQAAYEANRTLENGVDYSGALLYNRQPERAIDVLLELNERFPNTYQIATNLGTAYELTGNNVEALKWIEQGIALNPHSHSESEWVHVKILRAKIKAGDDLQWFTHHSVLGLPFREQGLFVDLLHFPHNNHGERATLQEMIDHVNRQLHERMAFAPDNDPVVANLLFDLGHLLALENAHEHGQDILKISQQYGDSKARQARIVLQWHELVGNLPQGLLTLYMMGGFLLIWLGYIFVYKALRWWRNRGQGSVGVVNVVSSVVIVLATTGVVVAGLMVVQSAHPFLGLHMSVFEGTVLFPMFAVFVGVAVGLWRTLAGKRKTPPKVG